jgi:hypothetical protein
MSAVAETLVVFCPMSRTRSIDCTSYYELESMEYQKRGIQLSPELWLVKIMVRWLHTAWQYTHAASCACLE